MVDYGPLYQAAGDQYGIDPLLLQTLAGKESNQDPNAVGPMITQGPAAGQHALGLMQFIPQTAAQYDVAYPMSPVQSTYGAANYLDTLLKKHDGNLRAALAEYSGNAGNQNAPYVKDVMDRYTGLSRAWSASGPSAAGPTTDTDPDSPTTGSSTYANLNRPNAPGELTTAKGNAGQPAPSVPTTDKGGVSISAPSTFAPPQKGAQASPAPDYLHDAPAPGAAPTPAPAAPAVSSGPDYLHDAPQQVDADGNPIKPMDTGQYLTAPTSPGAKAVGVPIAEGKVPGPGFQAAINVATDPVQKARIAAGQLNIPLDRIIEGPGGRMAAVDDQGQPYYIEPQAVFNDQSAKTRDESGEWQKAPGFISPYSRAVPLAQNPLTSPGNTAAAIAGATPGAVTTALSFAPAAVGNPLIGSTLVGGSTALVEGGRQWLANRLDPNNAAAPAWMNEQIGSDAVKNALANLGFRAGGYIFGPETKAAFSGQPTPPSTALKSGTTGAGEPGVQLNPAGEAAAASGPYAPSKAEEVAAIPTAVPVSRKPILTQAQAANRADKLIRYFAAQGPTDADTRTLVPGSSGTLAGVTGNAGLASLERLVRNIPEAANRFAGADTANKEAERAFTANLVGTPEDVAREEAQRESATSAGREAAFANKTPTDPSQQVAAIDQVLQGPAGKRPAVALPLRQIRGLFFTANPETGTQELETDPEMLYGVRQAITDALGPLSRGTDRDARAAAAQLQPILNGLDTTIEAGAPGFKDYLTQFHDLSQPINSMRFLQSRNLTDANGYPLLRPVDTLLKDIQKQRTLQPGVRPADALSDDQISQLENLRDDLRRQANLGKGKAIGSNTAQNLVGNQTLNMLTRPAAQEVGKAVATTFGGLPGYLVTSGVENALSGAVQRRQGWVLDALIDRLLNKDNSGVAALARPGAAP